MNILTDRLPESISIDGVNYAIDTDYRTAIKIMMAFEDDALSDTEKVYIMLTLLYGSIPENAQTAYDKGMLYLNVLDDKEENSSGRKTPRLYSFKKDAKYIFAAVNSAMDGKLKGDVHWWEFVTYFIDLPKDSTFARIIYLRSQKHKNKLTPDERREYNSMLDIVEIQPKNLATEKEIETMSQAEKYYNEAIRRRKEQ